VKSNKWGGWVVAVLLLVGAATVNRWAQSRLAKSFASLKRTSDTYSLPSPEQLVVASLGYRSALADLLYTDTRISYGLHFEEKRVFEHVGNYFDAMLELDPTFRAPYRLADTMMIFQPKLPPPENYRRARDFLTRALTHVPDDAQLWLQAGQFVAYLAPPHLPPGEDRNEWRVAGARMLARACDLLGSDQNLPHQCVTAASLLSRAGERDATINSLERVLKATDDEEVRRRALDFLRNQVDSQRAARFQEHTEALHAVTRQDLPLISRAQLQIIGPSFDEARCAGAREPGRDKGCATSFREWSAHLP
jgi:hypothetical protein